MFAPTLSSVAKTQRGKLGSFSQVDAAVVPLAREFRRRAHHGNGAHRVGGANGDDGVAYHARVEPKPNGINGD